MPSRVYTPSQIELDRRNLDKNESPEGYVAILGYDVGGRDNICRYCDYHPTCITKIGTPCSKERRKDGVFAVFKKLP